MILHVEVIRGDIGGMDARASLRVRHVAAIEEQGSQHLTFEFYYPIINRIHIYIYLVCYNTFFKII